MKEIEMKKTKKAKKLVFLETASGNFVDCSLIGRPTTTGELVKLLKSYKPDTEFGFRNQPMQSLFAVRYTDAVYVCFQ